ncbi:unnamed protein product [Schistosoma haematobium]|nr:unnamed protein product [Schistosoma haematobium]
MHMMRQNGEVREHVENGCITAICFSRVIGQYLSRFWMPRKTMWARAFYGSVLTLGNNTNNRVESLNRQIKRYVRKTDRLHKCMYKALKWSSMTFSRKSIEDQIISGRTYNYDAPQRLIPLLNMLTPFARSKVLYELEKMRFVNFEYESGEWLFMVDRGQHYEVDVSICQCNCSTFNMCRYPCRHLLLAYVKRRNLTAHQLLRCCCRWKLDSTHNLQNNTAISLRRRSKEYIQLQRLQRMCKQQIVEKYGERFANYVERKVYNFYLRIINS